VTIATISAKGWVVIPVEYRKKYDLHPGARVVLVDYGGVLSIVPALANPIQEGAGSLRGGTSMVKALLAERAQERARDR
jgi:AbrB family looped-hinge helix DNA binding protein